MAEIARLSGCTDWIDLDFVERQRTPERAMKLGIQLQLAGLSLSNTVSILEELGVERSRKAIHDWVQKADLQPIDGRSPNHVALDETVIRINDQQFWLYAVADPDTNDLLHLRLFATTTTALTEIFLGEFRQNTMSNPPIFWSMALNTSKLRWPELDSDFKLNEMEIETLSNESFENSNAELPRSQTVSATLSRKLPKIGSKHLPLGSMLLTKHYRSRPPRTEDPIYRLDPRLRTR